MKILNIAIGIHAIIIDPHKLATWPYFSTAICPNKVDPVRPNQKKLLVRPTETETQKME
jgi:hypothetical protein